MPPNQKKEKKKKQNKYKGACNPNLPPSLRLSCLCAKSLKPKKKEKKEGGRKKLFCAVHLLSAS